MADTVAEISEKDKLTIKKEADEEITVLVGGDREIMIMVVGSALLFDLST